MGRAFRNRIHLGPSKTLRELAEDKGDDFDDLAQLEIVRKDGTQYILGRNATDLSFVDWILDLANRAGDLIEIKFPESPNANG